MQCNIIIVAVCIDFEERRSIDLYSIYILMYIFDQKKISVLWDIVLKTEIGVFIVVAIFIFQYRTNVQYTTRPIPW